MLQIKKLAVVTLISGLAAACTTTGEISAPVHFKPIEAAQDFDRDLTPYSQQIALADGGFISRVDDFDR